MNFHGNGRIWIRLKSDLIAMHSNIEVLSTWSLAVEQTQSQAANSSAGSLSADKRDSLPLQTIVKSVKTAVCTRNR